MRIDDYNKIVWCDEELLEWKESFNDAFSQKEVMIFHISMIGWGFKLEDYNGNRMKTNIFHVEENKMSLIKAIIDNYEFKLEQPKKYYWRKKEEYLAMFEIDNGMFYLNKSGDRIFLNNNSEVYNVKTKFTEEEAREILKHDFYMFECVEVE